MPVIINNFEVIVEPTSEKNDAVKASTPTLTLKPQDIQRVAKYYQKRLLRIYAD